MDRLAHPMRIINQHTDVLRRALVAAKRKKYAAGGNIADNTPDDVQLAAWLPGEFRPPPLAGLADDAAVALARSIGRGKSPQPDNSTSDPFDAVAGSSATADPNVGQGLVNIGSNIAHLPQHFIEGNSPSGVVTEDNPTGGITPEQAGENFKTASMLMGTGASFAPEAAAGIFGGRLASGANLDALKEAQAMAARGAHPTNIWNQTGWFQGAEGKWRFEIPDNTAQIAPKAAQIFNDAPVNTRLTAPAAGILDHPELFSKYPHLGRIKTTLDKTSAPPGYPAAVGFYNSPATGEEMAAAMNQSLPPALSTLIHEFQHGVQEREGFLPTGGSSSYGYNDYRRLSTEVEARNSQKRQKMTPAERKANPPWTTEDVPIDEQIVRALQAQSKARGGQVSSDDMRFRSAINILRNS